MVFNIASMLPLHPAFKGRLTNPSDMLFRSLNGLHCNMASQVSISAVLRLTDVYRFDFDAATSTPESNDSISTLSSILRWLCSVHML